MKRHEAVAGLRECQRCGKSKNVSEFRPDKKAANGKRYPRNQCRACESKDWRRAWVAGKKGRLSATVLAVNAPPASVPNLSNGEGIEAKLEDAILQRMRLYQSDALDALHDLAMMPISENSMQNQVKFLACRRLIGDIEQGSRSSGRLDDTLRRLNEEYQKAAPRIKAIRERIIAFEQGPAPSIEAEPLQ